MTVREYHNTNLINRRILIQIAHSNPKADKYELYELAKSFVRSKYPTAGQYEGAMKFIADWLEI